MLRSKVYGPAPGNPCQEVCDPSHGGFPSSAGCGNCCRSVQHEIPWLCHTENAAPSCEGVWKPEWWNTREKGNLNHACAMCCGKTCATEHNLCGSCEQGKNNCECGGCYMDVVTNFVACSTENDTCICSGPEYDSGNSIFWPMLIFFLVVICGTVHVCKSKLNMTR